MIQHNAFAMVAARPEHPDWERLTERRTPLYRREDDIRSDFARDYTRVLHCRAYRRLKQKTQVFFNIDNDHICTRMEHVLHVESVSGTIAKTLGLNPELTQAIATAHDLGHAPFAHQGERILNDLSLKYTGETFWHERNGLHFVDDVELLEDNTNVMRNLNLTYAVRDGIISHCGEIDDNGLRPRGEFIDLQKDFTAPGEYQPITWEACVVKISDKIAYVGRDIEDAKKLGFLSREDIRTLMRIARANDEDALNTTIIIYNMISDICRNSTPDTGICLSDPGQEQLRQIKAFNYEHIYRNKRLLVFHEYARLVLTKLFETLYEAYCGAKTIDELAKMAHIYPELAGSFGGWLMRYCSFARRKEYGNRKIYGTLETDKIYARAILDYISGMTDGYAIKIFNELISY